MNATVTAAPLPVNFKGTPQQWIDALLDRLEVSFDGNTFVISDIEPQGNEGPWLKNGTQWWVWNPAESQYVPLDVSASVTDQIYVGDIANGPPDSSVYSIWLQLNGTAVNGLFYYAGTTAGWVAQQSPLQVGSVQLPMLAPQNTGSLITFDSNKNPIALPPGSPGTFLQSTGGVPIWNSPSNAKGIPVFINPVTLVNDLLTVTADEWSTISTLTANGVPLTASAIILGVTVDAQVEPSGSLQIRPGSSGATYVVGTTATFGSSSGISYAQSIVPFFVSAGVASFDWSVSTSGTYTGSSIVLLGYIT